MDEINIQSLIKPAEDIPGEYVAFTTYELCGQGNGIQEAKQSVIGIIQCHLSLYAKSQKEIPLPKHNIENAREFFEYCYQIDPTLVKMRLERTEKDIRTLEELAQRGMKLADYLLNRSDRRIELLADMTIRKDETIVIPARNSLPNLIFDFYRVEKMLKPREENYLC